MKIEKATWFMKDKKMEKYRNIHRQKGRGFEMNKYTYRGLKKKIDREVF